MIYSVSEINSLAAQTFLQNPIFNNIQITGEISGGKRYPSGHYYFTLKDKNASINCVMFKYAMNGLNFNPKDGDEVILKGNISIYEKTGKFQFVSQAMEIQGLGNLYIRFEKLKRELEEKGYFSSENKKPLPSFPKIIGIATSEAGSVLHDMIHVLRRRFPGFKIHLISIAVQGENATREIVNAIQKFNKMEQVDVIILARGGGSIEDLWAFNERPVADAIFASKIPIVSAIGHETDYTISDFVADFRAPTPSAAAEIILPEKQQLIREINTSQQKLSKALLNQVVLAKESLRFYSERPVLKQPQYLFSEQRQFIDQQLNQMIRELKHQLENYLDFNTIQNNKLNSLINNKIQIKSQFLQSQKMQLNSLDPLAILNRGYTYIEGESSEIISSIKQINENENISIHWHDGKAKAKVVNIENES